MTTDRSNEAVRRHLDDEAAADEDREIAEPEAMVEVARGTHEADDSSSELEVDARHHPAEAETIVGDGADGPSGRPSNLEEVDAHPSTEGIARQASPGAAALASDDPVLSGRTSTQEEISHIGLSAESRKFIEVAREKINEDIIEYYERLPKTREMDPSSQQDCLELLQYASSLISQPEPSVEDVIQARNDLAKVEIEFERTRGNRISFVLVAGIVYIVVILGIVAFYSGITLDNLSEDVTFLQIPIQVWVWAVIGSFTSMLVRAGQSPFRDRFQAFGWLLYRPVVGVVMGVLTYLLLVAGLIVFTNEGASQTRELVWIVAFVGAFSDTLSVNLLNRLIGNMSGQNGDATTNQVREGTVSSAVP